MTNIPSITLFGFISHINQYYNFTVGNYSVIQVWTQWDQRMNLSCAPLQPQSLAELWACRKSSVYIC